MSFYFKNSGFLLLLMSVFISASGQKKYTLKEALKRAKEENQELKSKYYEVKMARADVVSAKLPLNPSLENETIQMTRSSAFAKNTSWYNRQNREVFWHISKPFRWAGQRKNALAVANKKVQLADEKYQREERELFLEVALKWVEVWGLQKQLEIIGAAKDNIDSLSIINEKRYQNQVITSTDLLRTNLLAKQYKTRYQIALEKVKNHQKELGYLVGSEQGVQVDTSFYFTFHFTENTDSLFRIALTERSDVHLSRQRTALAGDNIKLQKSLAIPTPEVGMIHNPMSGVPFFGISFAIDLPVFNRNQGEIKKAVQLKEQARVISMDVERKVRTEIAVTHANYQLQQENITAYEQLLKQANHILNNVRQTYIKGGTTIVDFLEAQRSWLETRQQYYETQQAYMGSYLKLLYASGLIDQLILS